MMLKRALMTIFAVSSISFTCCVHAMCIQDSDKLSNHFIDVAAYRYCFEVQQLIDQGAQVNAQDNNGKTPLHKSAARGNREVVQKLIENGAHVNARNNKGETPLHMSACWNYPKTTQSLIINGAQVDARDNNEDTPLHNASTIPSSPEAAQVLIKEGADVNVTNNDSETPLHKFAIWGDLEGIQMLIDNGAQVNAQNNNGKTPLHESAKRGKREVVQALIDNRAQVDARDDNGATPLHEAHGSKAAQVLIDNAAHVNVSDEDGQTPLHNSVSRDDLETTRMLINNGAQVNAQSDVGDTPLYLSADRGGLNITRLLLDSGAQVEIKNRFGDTPLHRATMKDNPEMIKALIDDGAHIDAKNKRSETPLYKAFTLTYPESVAIMLIAHGADMECLHGVNIRDYCGNTPCAHVIEALRDGHNPYDIIVHSASIEEACKLLYMALGQKSTDHIDATIEKLAEKYDNFLYAIWNCALHNDVPSSILMRVFKLWPQKHSTLRLDDGNTPAHVIAYRYSDHTSLNLLRQYICQSRVDLRNNNGKYPIDIARDYGQTAVMDCLRRTCGVYKALLGIRPFCIESVEHIRDARKPVMGHNVSPIVYDIVNNRTCGSASLGSLIKRPCNSTTHPEYVRSNVNVNVRSTNVHLPSRVAANIMQFLPYGS